MNRFGGMRISWLILLVAAAAVALRNDREVAEATSPSLLTIATGRWPASVRFLLGPALRLDSGFQAALIVLTAGLGLGLAASRSPFVRKGRRWPGRGVAAIAAAGFGLAYSLTDEGLEVLADLVSTQPRFANPRSLSETFRSCANAPKDAVLGAWVLLLVAGRWRSEADALERLGRLVGWGWLAALGFDLFRSTLW